MDAAALREDADSAVAHGPDPFRPVARPWAEHAVREPHDHYIQAVPPPEFFEDPLVHEARVAVRRVRARGRVLGLSLGARIARHRGGAGEHDAERAGREGGSSDRI